MHVARSSYVDGARQSRRLSSICRRAAGTQGRPTDHRRESLVSVGEDSHARPPGRSAGDRGSGRTAARIVQSESALCGGSDGVSEDVLRPRRKTDSAIGQVWRLKLPALLDSM